MGYHKAFPDGTIDALEGLLKTAKDRRFLRRIQAVYFRVKFGYPSSQIAQMTGYSTGTVRNLHAAFVRDGMAVFALGVLAGAMPPI